MVLRTESPGPITHAERCAGFSISILHFGTTLSRVDRYEHAAVTEILLILTGGSRRNISDETSRWLYQDMQTVARHFDKSGQIGDCEGLNLPDVLPCYHLVFARCVPTHWLDRSHKRAPYCC